MRLCGRAGTVAADAALKSLYSKRQPGGASLQGGAFLKVSVPTRPPTTSSLNRARQMETVWQHRGRSTAAVLHARSEAKLWYISFVTRATFGAAGACIASSGGQICYDDFLIFALRVHVQASLRIFMHG